MPDTPKRSRVSHGRRLETPDSLAKVLRHDLRVPLFTPVTAPQVLLTVRPVIITLNRQLAVPVLLHTSRVWPAVKSTLLCNAQVPVNRSRNRKHAASLLPDRRAGRSRLSYVTISLTDTELLQRIRSPINDRRTSRPLRPVTARVDKIEAHSTRFNSTYTTTPASKRPPVLPAHHR